MMEKIDAIRLREQLGAQNVSSGSGHGPNAEKTAMQGLALLGLCLTVPAAAFTTYVWVFVLTASIWKRSTPLICKEHLLAILFVPLSYFLIRWSVSLIRFTIRPSADN